MGDEGTRVDGDIPPARRRGVLPWVVVVVALLAAASGLLGWRLATKRPLAEQGTLPGTSAPTGPGANHPGQPRVVHTEPPPGTTTTGPTTTGPTSTRPSTTGPTTTGPTTTGPSTTVTSSPAVTTPTTPGTVSTIPVTGRIRVLEIGDSLGVDLGEAMESTWPSTSVELTMAARGDTGLSNASYYNWRTALAGLLVSARPQVVVVLLGANDLQSMVTGSTILYDGTPPWNSEYAKRVTTIISESVRAHARVLWIGEPVMQTAFINAGMTRIDGIARRVVAHYPGAAAYLSSDSVLAPDGAFSFDARGPTGQEAQVRTPDGVHLMPEGADLLAAAVAEALAATWGLHVTG